MWRKAITLCEKTTFSSSCDTELVCSLNAKKMFSENFRLFIDFYFSLEVKLEKKCWGAPAGTPEAERGRRVSGRAVWRDMIANRLSRERSGLAPLWFLEQFPL